MWGNAQQNSQKRESSADSSPLYFPSVPTSLPPSYMNNQSKSNTPTQNQAPYIPPYASFSRPTHDIPADPYSSSSTSQAYPYGSNQHSNTHQRAPYDQACVPAAYSQAQSEMALPSVPSYITGLPPQTSSFNTPPYASFQSPPSPSPSPSTNQPLPTTIPPYASFKPLQPQQPSQPSHPSSVPAEAKPALEKTSPSQMPQNAPKSSKTKKSIISPVSAAADSLRMSIGTEIQAKTNEDGSTEGWLWQQRDVKHWDRLYFIIDGDKLFGFKHYPQQEEDSIPIQGLALRTGMIVTPTLPDSYPSVRGFCFSIQVQPNSMEVVVFDTITDADRQIWVKALEVSTKKNVINAWVPWEIESKTAALQKEQEIRQQKMLEEVRLQEEMDLRVSQHKEKVKQREIEKLGDVTLADELRSSYRKEDQILELDNAISRLYEEIQEIESLKLQAQEMNAVEENRTLCETIVQRTKLAQQLEQTKQRIIAERQQQSQVSKEAELQRIKEEHQRILQEEETRIRAELTAQFEKEAEMRQRELEERLRQEKEEQLKKTKEEEMQQVLRWLEENPSWREYYQSLGVTIEDIQDPKTLTILKKLIKDTARFVISTGVSNTEPELVPQSPESPAIIQESNFDVTSEEKRKSNPKSLSEELGNEDSVDVMSDEPDFLSMVPQRMPPPPPPSDDDELESMEVDSEILEPPKESFLSPQMEDIPAPSIPPPPGPAPPPVILSPFTASKKHESAPVKTQTSILDEIHKFQFKETNTVPTVSQLPKKNQDSLTALLSNQLTIFRTKLREDAPNDEDDEDYWD